MWITEQEIQAKAQTHIFIYGDDRTQKAYRGQADTFHGYPNCFPVFTRLWPCSDSSNIASHWCSVPLDMAKETIDRMCFNPIRKRLIANPGLQVIIVPKIGEGCSRLKWNNPELYKWIQEFLDSIRTK